MMSDEKEMYEWCCLQALLNKAGYLCEERKEKLREVSEGKGVDFFEHYKGEIEKNQDYFRLVMDEEGETA